MESVSWQSREVPRGLRRSILPDWTDDHSINHEGIIRRPEIMARKVLWALRGIRRTRNASTHSAVTTT